MPEKNGLSPSYEETSFADADKRGQLRLVGSRDGRDDSVTIHPDVDLYASILAVNEELSHVLPVERCGWVQVVRGSVLVNGDELNAGDGVAIGGASEINLSGTSKAEVLLFDMVK